MEEGPQMQSSKINGEEAKGDEFYEQIEAPKFVDLTAPDPYLPGDDRYWFCLRVGCDQNHEDEMDSETIYKNFVLRVMAARSPNVRLRKALCRKELSTNVKCPQSVPAKPSKSRVARLALISSISKKMVDPKVKVKPLSKTPNAKIKQGPVANAQTTPGNKKLKSNPNAFRSVRNPKVTAIAVPKNRSVAKTLVFHSPNKTVKASVARELNTPVKTLCAGMKKLEITSGKKHVLGYSRPVPSDASRKQLKGREVKSRVYDGLHSQSRKGQDPKSSKSLKTTSVANDLEKHLLTVPSDGVENDFNNKEIEEQLSNDSLEVSGTSKSDDRYGNSGFLTTNEALKQPLEENKVETFSGASKGDLNTMPNSEERISGEADAPNFEASSTKVINNDGKKCEQTSSLKMCIDETVEDDARKHTMDSCNMDNPGKIIDSDDKENHSAYNDNRQLDLSTDQTEKKFLVKQTSKAQKKIITAMNSPSKEISTVAATGAQERKNRKPKPTNPKPFRLRTDERVIYKGTNLEKKPHLVPLKEIKTFSTIPQKKNQTLIQSNKKCLQESQYGNDTSEISVKETNSTQMDHQLQNGTPNLRNLKEGGVQNVSKTSRKHTVSSQKKLVTRPEYSLDKRTQKLGNNLKKTKSPSVRQHTNLQVAVPCTNEIDSMTTAHQLDVIKETPQTILRPMEEGSPRLGRTSLITKTPTSATSGASLPGKRLTTLAKEPQFHNVHVPKSCTRRNI